MLHNKVPNTDPCVRPIDKSSQSLYSELILILFYFNYFNLLSNKKGEISLTDV